MALETTVFSFKISVPFEQWAAFNVSKENKQLMKEGITKDQLKRLTAPVGIPMVSNTPEEIAVSVAAQILQYKNSTS